jgi:SRSO17 transposase
MQDNGQLAGDCDLCLAQAAALGQPYAPGLECRPFGDTGEQHNCQVAVTLSVASDHASLPVAFRLYLPEPWANDEERRRKAGVPADIAFQTKPQIALDQIRQAIAEHVPEGIVLADAGYGNDTAFRSGLTALGLCYVVGVQSSTSVWAPGTEPMPAKSWSGAGRKPKLLRRDKSARPVKLAELAKTLPAKAWQTVRWREGAKGAMVSRFAALHVRPSHRDYWRAEPWPEEWLLIEWPQGEAEPTRYWLSILPPIRPSPRLSTPRNYAGASNATSRT